MEDGHVSSYRSSMALPENGLPLNPLLNHHSSNQHMGVSENVVYPIVPNGFADHYPSEKWLFHWEYNIPNIFRQTQMAIGMGYTTIFRPK